MVRKEKNAEDLKGKDINVRLEGGRGYCRQNTDPHLFLATSAPQVITADITQPHVLEPVFRGASVAYFSTPATQSALEVDVGAFFQFLNALVHP